MARPKAVPFRDALGRFAKRPTKSRKAKRKRTRTKGFAGKGTLGVKRINLPKEDISPAFRKFATPVKEGKKRIVYAFVEIESGYVQDPTSSRITVPVKIGRFTRKQLSKLTPDQLRERLRIAMPGASVTELKGFGHALLRSERKGKRFAKETGSKPRKKGNTRRNRSPKKGPRK